MKKIVLAAALLTLAGCSLPPDEPMSETELAQEEADAARVEELMRGVVADYQRESDPAKRDHIRAQAGDVLLQTLIVTGMQQSKCDNAAPGDKARLCAAAARYKAVTDDMGALVKGSIPHN